jgi:predicted aspartyl protease
MHRFFSLFATLTIWTCLSFALGIFLAIDLCGLPNFTALFLNPAQAAPAAPATSAAPAPAATDKRSQAIALYNAKDYRGAAQLLDDYLTVNSRDPYAAYYAALANQQIGNSAKSRLYYRQVFTLSPTSQIGGYARSILLKLDPSFAASQASAPSSGASRASAGPAQGAAPQTGTPAFDPSLPSECRVHYEKASSRIVLDTFIDGRQIKMMFDTGAPDVCIGKNQLTEIGAPLPSGPPAGTTGGSTNTAEVPYWNMKANIKVGQIERKGVNLVVLENNSADPLLGQEFFKNFDSTIDQGAGEIVFRQKALASKGGSIRNAVSVPFEFRAAGNRIIVQVTINGKSGQMMFDSGNTASAVSFFNRGEAAKFGLKIPDDAAIGHHTGIGGSSSCLIFPVSRMQLGPIDRSNVEVSVNDGGINEEGLPLLGQPFWQGYQYTIDYDKKLIHFVRR